MADDPVSVLVRAPRKVAIMDGIILARAIVARRQAGALAGNRQQGQSFEVREPRNEIWITQRLFRLNGHFVNPPLNASSSVCAVAISSH